MTKEQVETETAQSNSTDPSREKALGCSRAAIEKKAENIKILNLTELSSFTDYFVICSGTSDRQVQAIADSIEYTMSTLGIEVISAEGYSEGRWILMDFGDVVIHIFQEALREYYDLESLWADAPRVKIPAEYYGPAASRLN
ncbi:MAG TPA: ribosome silencing factor [Bdellovibrionales bacterium]|nr:MAG: ribosome silencing factor [Bdellovibrionales bacterium GWB1_52_6]OFZ05730.1 MAG: ribosome silencing factor [Bdellovibrionales bacterium GWA1_52_35]HAR42586.1 ribosome silencing factor [Bdellovibrionales bacterium]HCM40330.1 ribosome silencing factor [Bdellovibrionales bacterium]